MDWNQTQENPTLWRTNHNSKISCLQVPALETPPQHPARPAQPQSRQLQWRRQQQERPPLKRPLPPFRALMWVGVTTGTARDWINGWIFCQISCVFAFIITICSQSFPVFFASILHFLSPNIMLLILCIAPLSIFSRQLYVPTYVLLTFLSVIIAYMSYNCKS